MSNNIHPQVPAILDIFIFMTQFSQNSSQYPKVWSMTYDEHSYKLLKFEKNDFHDTILICIPGSLLIYVNKV